MAATPDNKGQGNDDATADPEEVDETLPVDAAAPPESGPPPLMAPDTREVIDDRYEILSWLGRGSMGNVYKVRDRQLDERVALKSLQRRFVENDEAVEQFHREVKMARRVTHHNVARTFDIGTEGDVPYLTMELIEGGSLKQFLRRDGPLGIDEFLGFVEPICSALEAAHAVGIIHRDLKPQNVMLAEDGRIVVTDFGVARQVANSAAGDTGPATVGTPGYMAPEQVEDSAHIDEQADIYALGIMMYEMLTGELPWRGKNPTAVAFARCIQPPPELPDDGDWPTSIRRTVTGCLQRDPEDRIESAERVFELLDESGNLDFRSYSGSNTRRSTATEWSDGATNALRDSSKKAIAVLPLNYHGSDDNAHLADGVTEELIDQLSRAEELAVLPRGAVDQFNAARVDPREAGRQLDVQIVVEGMLREFEETSKVRIGVISVQEGFQLWAQSYEPDPADLLDVGQRAAQAVERAVTVAPDEPARDAPSDPATIDLYIRGRHELKENWYSDLSQAIDLFEDALERAPDDPRVLSGLAIAQARNAFLDDPNRHDRVDEATETARRAIETAPDWPEPHVALAMAKYNAVDFDAALRALDEVLQIAPDYYRVHELRGRILAEVGSLETAINHLQQALEHNPYLHTTRWDLARAHALAGDWPRAQELMERGVDSEWARVLQYAHKARLDLWREEPWWAEDPPEPAAPEDTVYRHVPETMRHITDGGELTDRHKRQITELLDEHGADSRFLTMQYQLQTEIGVRAGDRTYALDQLRKACEAGLVDINWLEYCPLLAPLDGDPTVEEVTETVQRRIAHIRTDRSDDSSPGRRS